MWYPLWYVVWVGGRGGVSMDKGPNDRACYYDGTLWRKPWKSDYRTRVSAAHDDNDDDGAPWVIYYNFQQCLLAQCNNSYWSIMIMIGQWCCPLQYDDDHDHDCYDNDDHHHYYDVQWWGMMIVAVVMVVYARRGGWALPWVCISKRAAHTMMVPRCSTISPRWTSRVMVRHDNEDDEGDDGDGSDTVKGCSLCWKGSCCWAWIPVLQYAMGLVVGVHAWSSLVDDARVLRGLIAHAHLKAECTATASINGLI